MIRKKLGVICMFLIAVLLISNIESAIVFGQSFDSSTDNSLRRPRIQDISSQIPGSFGVSEEYSPIVISVDNYEPNVLTDNLLGEGRIIPVFVNLKGYSVDPTLEPIIKSGRIFVKDVKSKPEHANAKSLFIAGTRYFPPDVPGISDMGFVVVYLKPLPREHLPVEQVAIFRDLPIIKQNEILDKIKDKLVNITETEKNNILNEQARSLILQQKDQDWIKLLPRKNAFLEELTIEMQADLSYDVNSGFGVTEEELVLDYDNNKRSFWQGQGSVGLSEIKGNTAVLSLFAGKDRAIQNNILLNEGQTSNVFTLSSGLGIGSGYNVFRGNFKVRLEDIRDKGNRAVFNIDGKTVVLAKGDRLYSGSPWVVQEIIVDDSFNKITLELRRRERVILQNTKSLERRELVREALRGKGEIIEKEINGTGVSVVSEYPIREPGSDVERNVKQWDDAINNAINSLSSSRDSALELNFIRAVITQESGGKENAANGGCVGLMQFCSSTAITYGLCDSGGCSIRDDRAIGAKNIHAGVKYLNNLLGQFSSNSDRINFALASYNGGFGVVKKGIEKTGQSNPSWNEVSNVLTPNMFRETGDSAYARASDSELENKIKIMKDYVSSIRGYLVYYNGGFTTASVSSSSPGKYKSVQLIPGATEDDFRDVIKEYEKIANDFPDEETFYKDISASEQAIKKDKIAAKALYRIAKIYEDLGSNTNAAIYYTRLLNEYPEYASKNGINELTVESIKLKGDWDIRKATFSDEIITATLLNVEEVKPDKQANAKISIKAKGDEFPIAYQFNHDQDIQNTDYKIGAIYEDRIELIKKSSPTLTPVTLQKDQEKEIPGNGNIQFVLRLIETNAKSTKEAKVKIIPNSNLARSRTEFNIHLPIEKRAIQLSPERIESEIKRAEAITKKLESISSKLNQITTWLGRACFALGTIFSIKNGFAGKDRLQARQEVASEYDAKCRKKYGQQTDLSSCLGKKNKEGKDDNDFKKEMEERENILTQKYKDFSDYRKSVNGFTGTDADRERFLQERQLKLLKESGIPNGDYKTYENLIENNQLTEEEISSLTIGYSLDPKSSRYENLKGKFEKRNKDLTEANVYRENLLKNINSDPNIASFVEKSDPIFLKNAEAVSSTEKLGSVGQPILIDSAYYIVYNGVLKRAEIKNLGDNSGRRIATIKADVNGKEEEKSFIIQNLVDTSGFGSAILKKKVVVNNCRIQIVPYNGGDYLVVRPEHYGQGGANAIGVFNAGKNGIMQDEDDLYRRTLTFPNPEFNTAADIINRYNAVIKNNNCEVKQVNLATGESAAVEIASQLSEQTQCEYFMKPEECQILYRICDPVVCPSSRFDLGGKVHVDDPVKTGIVGSAILGLPRGTVCLSGIYAGLKNLESVSKAYGQCLKTARDEDRSTGLCDKIQSVYLCEFVWKNVVPLATSGIIFNPKKIFTGKPFNDNNGGEYLNFQENYENTKRTMNFFINDYAKNSFALFKSNSVNEVGGEICKRVFFSSVPGGDIFNKIGKPENPVQYTAWFDEKVYSKTRVLTSSYSVFYQIYAGDNNLDLLNRGFIEYSVYLDDPELGKYYITNPVRKRLNANDGVVENVDIIAPSGYSKICVEVNGRANCNFGKVSSGFLLNYLADYYTSSQATKKIESAEECSSTYSEQYRVGQATPFAYSRNSLSAFSADPLAARQSRIRAGSDYSSAGQKFGVTANGIVRQCSVVNPAAGTGRENDWNIVGTCGKDKLTNADLGSCWLNLQSVKDSINTDFLRDNTIEEIHNKTKGDINKFRDLFERKAELSEETIQDDFAKIDTARNNIRIAEDKLHEGRESFITRLKKDSPALRGDYSGFLDKEYQDNLKGILDEADDKLRTLDILSNNGIGEIRFVRNEIREMRIWIEKEKDILEFKSCDLDKNNECKFNLNKEKPEFLVIYGENNYLLIIEAGEIRIITGSAVGDFKEKGFDADSDGSDDFKIKYTEKENLYEVTVNRIKSLTGGTVTSGTTTSTTVIYGPFLSNTVKGTENGKCELVNDVWKCTGFIKDEEVLIRDAFNLNNFQFKLEDIYVDNSLGSVLGFDVDFGGEQISCGSGFRNLFAVVLRNYQDCNGFRAIQMKADKINLNGKNDFSIRFDVKEENFEFDHPAIFYKFENGKWYLKKPLDNNYNEIRNDIDYKTLLNDQKYDIINGLKNKNFLEGINYILEFTWRNPYSDDKSLFVFYKQQQLIAFPHGSDRFDSLKKLTSAFKNLYNFGVSSVPTQVQTFKDKILDIFNKVNPAFVEFEYEEDAFNDKPNLLFKFNNGKWMWYVPGSVTSEGRGTYKPMSNYDTQLIQDSSYRQIFGKLSRNENDFKEGAFVLLDYVQNGDGDYSDDEIIVKFEGRNLPIPHGEVDNNKLKRFLRVS